MDHEATVREMIALINKIPQGRVATYGQIATLAGKPGNARQVGAILRALPEDSGVPWQRVVNAQGRISDRNNTAAEGLQRFLLLREGINVMKTGKIDLRVFQWKPGPTS